MKDKTCVVPMKDFLGLKYKLSTFVTEDKDESKKVNGINKIVVDDELNYEDYKNVLLNISYMRHEMNKVQSKHHDIGSCKN